MPYISTETLLGAALLVVLAVGYQYLPAGTTAAAGGANGSSKSAKKRAKKKAKGEAGSGGSNGASTPQQGSELPSTTVNAKPETNGKGKNEGPQKKKLLAERLLPKEPKTRVDDMLAPEDRPPSIARVMKVSSTSTPTFASISGGSSASPAQPVQPSSGQSEPLGEVIDTANGTGDKVSNFEDDYAATSDLEREEEFKPVPSKKKANDGWNVVASQKKKSTASAFSSASGYDPRQSTSLPLPTATRNQKKNAKKSEAKKEARAAEEEDRQRRLAMHKRNLERERINELYAAKQSNPARGKALGSGAKATVTPNGKLVWD